MKQIIAIIERSSEGMYSIYMSHADELSYSIIGTGFSEGEALEDFHKGYKAMKEHYKKVGKRFEEVAFTFQHDAVTYLPYYAKLKSKL